MWYLNLLDWTATATPKTCLFGILGSLRRRINIVGIKSATLYGNQKDPTGFYQAGT